MRYYLLNRSLKRKDVGVAFGQTSELWDLDFIKGIPYIKQLESLPNYHGKLRNDEFPNWKPRIKFELTEKGKKTDLVDIPNINCNGMLVSPKFKELLEKFNLMEHRFYSGKLKVGDFFMKYFWFHPKANYFEWFDFNKSKVLFRLEDNPLISIKSYEDYQKYHKKGGFKLEKVVLNNAFPEYDLFYLPYLNRNTEFFISETLMRAIKKEKITGIEIKEQDII